MQKGTITVPNMAKYYKGLDGQEEALRFIDSILTPEERLTAEALYRNNSEPLLPKGEIYVYCKWSGAWDEFGNKVFGMYLINDGQVIDKIACTSGQDYAQDVVWPLDDKSGSMRPLPEGVYDFGKLDDLGYDPGSSDGFGQWVYPLIPRAAIKRSKLLIHADRNRRTSPGSAGCLCPYSLDTMFRFVKWMSAAAKPQFLVMDHELGFLAKTSNFKAPDLKPGKAAPEATQLITMEQATHIFGRSPTTEQLADLNNTLNKFEINTTPRMRHFLSQCAKESGGLKWMKELADGTAYEGRLDIGNTQKGDGPKFKGAGIIQLTGRANYQEFANFIGDQKVMTGCDYVAEKYPMLASGFWWHNNKMNSFCDRPDVTVEMITRRVNGGLRGLDERIEYFKRATEVIP
jgi:predicted chitinase